MRNTTDNNGTPMLCTYPKFGCAKTPPPGYAECSRQCGHDGPCAMDFAPTIIGEAERLLLGVRGTCQRLADDLGLKPEQVTPDYMVLPWRMYWGWIIGRYSTYYPFSYAKKRTRVTLNIFRLVPKVHWTVVKETE